MKKVFKLFGMLLSVLLLGLALASCDNNQEEPGEKTYTVTFYDGGSTDVVLDTQEVKEGEKATNWTPDPKSDGSVFRGWYSTPSLSHEFDFDEPITKDTAVFSMWATVAEDTNKWEITGNLSGDLAASDWGKGHKDTDIFALDKVEGEPNVFEGTFGLIEGNEFQFAVLEFAGTDVKWKYQMGGSLLEDGNDDYFEKVGNYLDPSTGYKANIKVKVSGLYKFTITTDLVTPTAGVIEVERLGDFTVDVYFAPFIGGTPAGGANTTSYEDLKFPVGKADGDNIVWTGEFSFNAGELLQIYMVDKDYSVQLSGLNKSIDKENTDAENVNLNSANEIEIINSGKYKVVVTADKEVAEEVTEDYVVVNKSTYADENKYEKYTVAINRIGDYETTKGVVYDTFNFKYNGNGTDHTVYLRNGAKFPNVKEPTVNEGQAVSGWYYLVGEEKHGISYNREVYQTSGKTYEVNYEVVDANTKDNRDFKLTGLATVDGVETDWSKYTSLKQTGNYTYEAEIVVNDNASFQIVSYWYGLHQGVFLRGGNVVSKDVINTADFSNITIVKAGTYKLSLNSITKEITITPVTK